LPLEQGNRGTAANIESMLFRAFFGLTALLMLWYFMLLYFRIMANALQRHGYSRWWVFVPGVALLVLLGESIAGRRRLKDR
jgi:hypothetical protein